VYTLGLEPRYDVGPRHYDLQLYVAESLLSGGAISGRVPCREGDSIAVSWRKHSNDNDDTTAVTIDYTITTSVGASAIFVSGWGLAASGKGSGGSPPTWTKIEGTKSCKLTLPLSTTPSY
jgi:hypothetical protein